MDQPLFPPLNTRGCILALTNPLTTYVLHCYNRQKQWIEMERTTILTREERMIDYQDLRYLLTYHVYCKHPRRKSVYHNLPVLFADNSQFVSFCKQIFLRYKTVQERLQLCCYSWQSIVEHLIFDLFRWKQHELLIFLFDEYKLPLFHVDNFHFEDDHLPDLSALPILRSPSNYNAFHLAFYYLSQPMIHFFFETATIHDYCQSQVNNYLRCIDIMLTYNHHSMYFHQIMSVLDYFLQNMYIDWNHPSFQGSIMELISKLILSTDHDQGTEESVKSLLHFQLPVIEKLCSVFGLQYHQIQVETPSFFELDNQGFGHLTTYTTTIIHALIDKYFPYSNKVCFYLMYLLDHHSTDSSSVNKRTLREQWNELEHFMDVLERGLWKRKHSDNSLIQIFSAGFEVRLLSWTQQVIMKFVRLGVEITCFPVNEEQFEQEETEDEEESSIECRCSDVFEEEKELKSWQNQVLWVRLCRFVPFHELLQVCSHLLSPNQLSSLNMQLLWYKEFTFMECIWKQSREDILRWCPFSK